MKYENIDEAAQYQEACRKVKQIAAAIKQIRIKYYLNFSKISDADKQAYDELYKQIERIASENGLDRLKAELIEEISDKYDGKISDEGENGTFSLEDKTFKAYCGAIDAGEQALKEGKLKKAKIYQHQASIYMQKLKELDVNSEQNKLVEMAIHYKRKKFAELVPAKEEQAVDWESLMKSYYENEQVQDRNEAKNQIEEAVLEATKEHEVKDTTEMILE